MAVDLDQIVPWGRSFWEYQLMFRLMDDDLASGVLDCGGGPASFVAELHALGIRAIAADPIYLCTGSDIKARFEAVAEPIVSQLRASPEDWTWTCHRNPNDLLANRRLALLKFLADYDEGLLQGRYIVGELPALPFASQSVGLAVCSHLLFLYSEVLPADFHIQATLELCRVAREVRIFPLLGLNGQTSPHLEPVMEAVRLAGWSSEITIVPYEFQKGGNQMLRIFRSKFTCAQRRTLGKGQTFAHDLRITMLFANSKPSTK